MGRNEISLIDVASESNKDENEVVENENSTIDSESEYGARKGNDEDLNSDASSTNVCEWNGYMEIKLLFVLKLMYKTCNKTTKLWLSSTNLFEWEN